jgi:hypothetical protein
MKKKILAILTIIACSTIIIGAIASAGSGACTKCDCKAFKRPAFTKVTPDTPCANCGHAYKDHK